MKFRTTEELLEFMNTIDLEKSTLVFKGDETIAVTEGKDCDCARENNVCSCGTTKVEEESSAIVVESGQILVETFTNAPQFKLVVTEEDKNTFFVKDFHAIKDSCGTGSITLEDREAKMNMCEMDGVATVTLDVIIEGKKLKGVPFALVKTEDTPYLQLSKSRIL